MKRVIIAEDQSTNDINRLESDLRSYQSALTGCKADIGLVDVDGKQTRIAAYAAVTQLNAVGGSPVVWTQLANDITQYCTNVGDGIYIVLPVSIARFNLNNASHDEVLDQFDESVIDSVSKEVSLCLDFLNDVSDVNQVIRYIESNRKLAEMYASGEAIGFSFSSINPGTVYFSTPSSHLYEASANINADILGNLEESGYSDLQRDALQVAENLGDRNLFVYEDDDFLLFTNPERSLDIEIPIDEIEGYRNVKELTNLVRRYAKTRYGVEF